MMTRVVLLSSMTWLVTATAAWAGGVMGSGPVPVAGGENFSCSVSNIGTKDLASVHIVVHLDDATTSVEQTCSPLAPGAACTITGFASGSFRRWCTVTGGTKKSARGTFCNETSDVCVEIH